MNRLTYKEAYDKIIDAYFKDDIRPYRSEFCFCGNLNDKDMDWTSFGDNKRAYYSKEQYQQMEEALLGTIRNWAFNGKLGKEKYIEPQSGALLSKYEFYEDALFEGMCNALEVLKQIHKSRGEDVDGEITPFTKRQLENTHI